MRLKTKNVDWEHSKLIWDNNSTLETIFWDWEHWFTCELYDHGWKITILSGVRSKADDPKGRKQTILKRMKADDLLSQSRWSMGQSRRSRAKADDLGSKADDLLGQSRRSMGQSRRSRSKRTIWRAESRRSYGPKRTILFEIWTILFEVKRNHAILRDESRRSYGPKRTILSEVYETLQSWGMKADDPWIYFMKNQND